MRQRKDKAYLIPGLIPSAVLGGYWNLPTINLQLQVYGIMSGSQIKAGASGPGQVPGLGSNSYLGFKYLKEEN